VLDIEQSSLTKSRQTITVGNIKTSSNI